MPLLSLLLGCTTSTKDEPANTVGQNFRPTMPTSTCGLREYAFLTTQDMGTILSSSKREEFSLTKESLTALLANYNLPLPPPTNGVETYYIEYQTQDKGEPTNATGMILFPEGKQKAPVIVWLHPTMGFNDNCSPTATGIIGAAYPAIFASLGFIVVAPDYIGMRGWTGESENLHAYISAEATAIFSIDALRALPNLIQNYGKDISWNDQEIILWGASEGGFAALTTDRYLPHYAPEYRTMATIAATPVSDVFALTQLGLSEFSPASLGVIGVEVTLNQWYEANIELETMLLPEFSNVEQALFSSCDDFGDVSSVSTVEDIFQPSFIEGMLLDDGSTAPWDCFAKDNAIADKVPHIRTAPTFIVTAEMDDLAWPDPVHDDISTLCEQGYTIEHRQCAGAEHVDGILDSLGEQWKWLQARLQNESLEETCRVTDPIICERQ